MCYSDRPNLHSFLTVYSDQAIWTVQVNLTHRTMFSLGRRQVGPTFQTHRLHRCHSTHARWRLCMRSTMTLSPPHAHVSICEASPRPHLPFEPILSLSLVHSRLLCPILYSGRERGSRARAHLSAALEPATPPPSSPFNATSIFPYPSPCHPVNRQERLRCSQLRQPRPVSLYSIPVSRFPRHLAL